MVQKARGGKKADAWKTGGCSRLKVEALHKHGNSVMHKESAAADMARIHMDDSGGLGRMVAREYLRCNDQ